MKEELFYLYDISQKKWFDSVKNTYIMECNKKGRHASPLMYVEAFGREGCLLGTRKGWWPVAGIRFSGP